MQSQTMNGNYSLPFLDVDGKVIHLVQRAPPGTRSHSNGAGGNEPRARERTPNQLRGQQIFRGLDGMVLGTMAIPVSTNGGVRILIENLKRD